MMLLQNYACRDIFNSGRWAAILTDSYIIWGKEVLCGFIARTGLPNSRNLRIVSSETAKDFFMEKEIWKDVIDYEGLYQVSNLGNVKSSCIRSGSSGKVLKPRKSPNGYLYVNLNKNSKGLNKSIHRLVAIAFIGVSEMVDHHDTNKENNNISNLRLCSRAQNSANSTKTNKKTHSRFKGVTLDKRSSRWVAQTKHKGKYIFIGSFLNEEKAARAYDKRIINIFGDFARTNDMMGLYE